MNIFHLVLYQTGNSRNTVNYLLHQFGWRNSNELETFRLFNVFAKEIIGVSEESTTTKIFVSCWKTPLVENFPEVVQSHGSNFITYQTLPRIMIPPSQKLKKLTSREGRSTATANTCCHGDTVYFLVVIDRESVLPSIFRKPHNVGSRSNS